MGNTLHRLAAGMSLEPVDSSNSMSGIPTFGGQRSNCLHHKTFVGLPWLVEQREDREAIIRGDGEMANRKELLGELTVTRES